MESHIKPCTHRGEIAFSTKSKCCGSRTETVHVYRCDLHRLCTYRPYKGGQAEKVCLRCDQLSPPLDGLKAREN